MGIEITIVWIIGFIGFIIYWSVEIYFTFHKKIEALPLFLVVFSNWISMFPILYVMSCQLFLHFQRPYISQRIIEIRQQKRNDNTQNKIYKQKNNKHKNSKTGLLVFRGILGCVGV